MGSWKPQMEYFSSLPSYQCCYIDNRGVGLSSAPVGAYSYVDIEIYFLFIFLLKLRAHQMANDSMLLVNELGWKSYHLVGTYQILFLFDKLIRLGLSMGGMIALELALIDTRILTLTLMVTHAGGANAYIPVCINFIFFLSRI